MAMAATAKTCTAYHTSSGQAEALLDKGHTKLLQQLSKYIVGNRKGIDVYHSTRKYHIGAPCHIWGLCLGLIIWGLCLLHSENKTFGT